MSIVSVERHPTDDALELFALGQLTDTSLEAVEEHLLLCAPCQDRLTGIDRYVSHIKAACSALETEAPKPKKSFRFARILSIPRPALAGAFAVLAGLVLFPMMRPQDSGRPDGAVQLIALRGAPAESEAGRPVRLDIDASGLPAFPSYLVSVVDFSGRQVWFTQSVPSESRLSVRVPLSLVPGTYWVRIGGPGSEPVREFALHLK